MPRTKYTKPPGPLPAIEQVQRSEFRFRNSQWDKLRKLLPSKLQELPVPSDYIVAAANESHAPTRTLKTIADAVIHETEGAIRSHLTVRSLSSEHRMPTPANVRAAIRRLRKALEPFAREWVDTVTADLIPANLDDLLAVREQELMGLKAPSKLAMLCRLVGNVVKERISAYDETISEQDTARYVDAALACGGVKHPDFAKHRDRLASLIFPKD